MSDLAEPGRLVLVVGPSGAGKDTLLRLACEECAGDARVVFPRRVITRAADGSEDHDSLSDADFSRAVSEGVFCIHWEAHGHCYGIPASADAAIRAGKTVVCNVSRAVIAPLRQCYANVTAVTVTAPADVLAQRVASRRRESDDVASRKARVAVAEVETDVEIVNVGDPALAAAKLVAIVRA